MALFKIKSQNIEEGAITQELFDVTVSESIQSLKISNVSVANSTYHVLDDTAVNVGGGYLVVTGSGFNSNSVVIVGSTPALATSYINSTTLHVEVDAASARTYDVYVTNDDGDFALKKNGVTYSGSPTWITASSLNSVINAVSFTGSFSATGATSYSNTTSLPTGFNLVSANGYYYGTIEIESDTTYNFTIRATDDENQDSDRAFSLDAITAIPVEYLVVAGGGGGGTGGGGGGGAGGLLTGTSYIVPGSGTKNVVVGAGGQGNGYYIYYDGTFYSKSPGSNSSFGDIVSVGGGMGGSDNPGQYNGSDGGSGGGSADRVTFGGSGIPGQGNRGGNGAAGPSAEYAGGGGGAGAQGGDAIVGTAGSGGNGLQSSISGTATYYAGGGAAHGGASGGLGGGGASVPYGSNGDSGTATPNTGGGGGGGSQTNSGRGGSGIVIIRHSDVYSQASTTGSPTITTAGGYRVYQFTSSGSITF